MLTPADIGASREKERPKVFPVVGRSVRTHPASGGKLRRESTQAVVDSEIPPRLVKQTTAALQRRSSMGLWGRRLSLLHVFLLLSVSLLKLLGLLLMPLFHLLLLRVVCSLLSHLLVLFLLLLLQFLALLVLLLLELFLVSLILLIHLLVPGVRRSGVLHRWQLIGMDGIGPSIFTRSGLVSATIRRRIVWPSGLAGGYCVPPAELTGTCCSGNRWLAMIL